MTQHTRSEAQQIPTNRKPTATSIERVREAAAINERRATEISQATFRAAEKAFSQQR